MKFKGTWVFTLVVAAAVGFAAWDYQKQQQDQAQKAEAAQLIQGFDIGKIADFQFIGNAGSFKAVNRDGEWNIIEPIQDKADYSSLEGLLLGLAEESMTVVEVGDSPKWSQYGLDKPEASLLLNMRDGSSFRIDVGSKRAYNDGYYVRKNESNQLFLGSSAWTNYLSKTANDVRNRELYFGPTSYDRVEIKNMSEEMVFSLKDRKWVASRDKKILIDSSAVTEYVSLLEHLRADAIVADRASSGAKKLYNLHKPQFVVSLKSDREKLNWSISFSKEKNNEIFVNVGSDRPIYRIQSRKLESLKKEFSFFRNKEYPFMIDQNRVPSFRIKKSEQEKERQFVKQDGSWQIAVDEPHMKVSQEGIRNMLFEIRNLRVKEFIAGGESRKKPKAQNGLVFLDVMGNKTFELLWSDEEKVNEDKRFKVWTTLSNEAFWVGAADFQKFLDHELMIPDGSNQEGM